MEDQKDISAELWREYDFAGRVYHIDEPQALVRGATTHRVIAKDGIVHLVPAPGTSGCVVRWQPRASTNPVQF